MDRMSIRYEIQHNIQEVIASWAPVLGPAKDGPCRHEGMALVCARGTVFAHCDDCGCRWERPQSQERVYKVNGEEIAVRWVDGVGGALTSRAA